jgi:RNA polymerase sigma factor (sigma-70 family)
MRTKIKREELILEGLNVVDSTLNYAIGKYHLTSFMSKEDIEDLRQEGVVEMIKAVDERYNPKRGVALSTFLTHRMRGFCKDYLKKRSKTRWRESTQATEIVNENISRVFDLNREQALVVFNKLNLTSKSVQNFVLNVTEDSYEIFESLKSSGASDAYIYILLSFYVLDRSVKNIAKEFNVSPRRIYQIKKETLRILKQKLVEKGILKEEEICC